MELISKKSDFPTIMIIDDTPANLDILSDAFDELGFRVLSFLSGEHALKAALNDPPDIILLDIVMPEIDGFEVLRRLKQDDATRDIPVIFISALDSDIDEEQGLALGAVDYITKPIKLPIVRARVQTHLQLKMYRDSIEVQVHERTAELREANEELDLLIKSLSSIIIGVSSKDRITHWSPFAEEILGLKFNDVIGKQFCHLVIPWDRALVYEAIANCILYEKTIRLADTRYEDVHGKSGILGLTVNPLIRSGNILKGFMILGRDITEQRQLESQRLQSNKLEAIGQLAAGISHEINTPLQYAGDNLIFLNKSFTGLIKHLEIFDKASQCITDKNIFSECINEIETHGKLIELPFLIDQIPNALEQSLEGIKRVSQIIQSMKSFSHPGSGIKSSANINKAIENTIAVSRNAWKYEATLQLDLDPNLPNVPCFESELNQVFLNLIVNAADAIHEAKEKNIIENGLIIIQTMIDNSNAVIKITDNGAGIPLHIREKIFDPFFTTKDVGKGTGQGLAISHSIIVKKHEGSLYFESEVGKGTSFIIKLPLENHP